MAMEFDAVELKVYCCARKTVLFCDHSTAELERQSLRALDALLSKAVGDPQLKCLLTATAVAAGTCFCDGEGGHCYTEKGIKSASYKLAL